MNNTPHLGQSISMGVVLFIASFSIIGLMALQSGALR